MLRKDTTMPEITGCMVAKLVNEWLVEDGLKPMRPQEIYSNWRKRNMGPRVDLETAEKEAIVFYDKKRNRVEKPDLRSLVSKPE